MIYKFTDQVEFWQQVLSAVDQTVLEASDVFRLAMSGGSAAQLLDHLRATDFDFSKTELWQVDERFVPVDDLDSNIRLLDTKLGETPIERKYFPILETREASVSAYNSQLKEDPDGYLFDLTILGVGPDGHTASLFPNTAVLETEALVVSSETIVFAVRERMSLSFAAIAKSRRVLILMMGAGKADIFATLTDPATSYLDCPGKKALDMPQTDVLWLNG